MIQRKPFAENILLKSRKYEKSRNLSDVEIIHDYEQVQALFFNYNFHAADAWTEPLI